MDHKLLHSRRHHLALALVACGMAAMLAAPARAQERDPFEPQSTSSVAETQDSAPVPAAESGTSAKPQDVAGRASTAPERMPMTGAEPTDWVVLAYFLIAAGAGALVLSRCVRRPAPDA